MFQTSELAEKEEMEKQIREYVTLNTPSSDKRRRIRCELGDYVAVYLEEDQGWERGRIVIWHIPAMNIYFFTYLKIVYLYI